MGIFKWVGSKFELAIADFTKAIELHANAIHYSRRGHARLIDEDLKGAISDFNQALSLEPQYEFLSWMIYANRGMLSYFKASRKRRKVISTGVLSRIMVIGSCFTFICVLLKNAFGKGAACASIAKKELPRTNQATIISGTILGA